MKQKSKRSISDYFLSLPTKKRATIYCADSNNPDKGDPADDETSLFTTKRSLLGVWMCVGLVPLLLQARSYIKFMTPHKITQDLIPPIEFQAETADREEHCPVEGLMVAGAWWNIEVTHYYTAPEGKLCHFVVPQYNIHGAYLLETVRVAPSSTTPASCSGESYPFQHYFYHGSIGYYAFYEEASGTYCSIDQTAYVEVNGLVDTFGRTANSTTRSSRSA
ncbi:unnamed protein product [Phytophthora lilii]|uniref:Unnamed protein product n=1 Tax=Phytophthora lilii TaxID=2077276 RepID=A0A9W6TMT4_9STRA|nr:unnamed protein product [Phytophthora lilii]